MDFYTLLDLAALAVAVVVVLSLVGLVVVLSLYLARRGKKQRREKGNSRPGFSAPVHPPSKPFFSFSSSDDEDDEPDITTFATRDIPSSGLFSASERRREYIRRGKSPSGVIDGVYNDAYRENGRPYNDMDRDWDAGA